MARVYNLKEAAVELGYTEKGLRLIVERSKRALAGQRVDGPTIAFRQGRKKAPYQIDEEAIREFKRRFTFDPWHATPRAPVAPQVFRRAMPTALPKPANNFGLDPALWS